MNIPIVYEDDWLLVVDKPSGLLVIPTPRNEKRTLTSILNDDLKSRNITYRVHPCHRLDRETSGLIVYAKGKSMQQKVMSLFKEKKIAKTYLAFVQGILLKKSGQLSHSIEGSNAITGYRVIEEKKDYSVVEVKPLTGKTNQIRIHFKQIAHPLVGETKFAFRKDYALRAKRTLLHACTLDFCHPQTNAKLHLEAGLPEDMQHFLEVH